MKNITPTHWLKYNHREDEADKDGVAFIPSADGKTVEVFDTFTKVHGRMEVIAEISEESRRTMSAEDARKLWKSLTLDTVGGSHSYTHVPLG